MRTSQPGYRRPDRAELVIVGAVEGDADVLGEAVSLEDGEAGGGEELRNLQRERRAARSGEPEAAAEVRADALGGGPRLRLVLGDERGPERRARLPQAREFAPLLQRLTEEPLLFLRLPREV
jgi:hypothetical protein